MKGQPYERSMEIARYIIENKSTVRGAASKFGISKSTVHKDIRTRLPLISPRLYRQCSEILRKNKEERHLRGGLATKEKYEKLKV